MFCICPSFMVFRNTSPESALRVAMSKSDLHLLESVSEVGARRRAEPRQRCTREPLVVGPPWRISAVLTESWASCPDVEVGALAGRRSHDGEPFIGDAPYCPARPRAKSFRTAVDGDRSTALPSRAVPPRAAADPRARAPRRAGRRP